MTVKVLYFASLRELTGLREEEYTLEDGAGLAFLQQAVLGRHHDLRSMAPRLRWAVNEAYAKPETRLSSGDTVALIPPVSGG